MNLRYLVRPISDRTWMRPAGQRVRSQFTASWSNTCELLQRELDQLDGKRLVLEIDIREQDLRLDGTVRANARPASDAVVVAFESKHGPLQYRSDLYYAVASGARNAPAWQHNVRAVALTLEALRKVNRLGATQRGEQYRGYKQLGAGAGVEATSMTTEMALDILREGARIGGVDVPLNEQLRRAQKFTHPDRNGGDRSRWNAIDQAEQVLRRAGRL